MLDTQRLVPYDEQLSVTSKLDTETQQPSPTHSRLSGFAHLSLVASGLNFATQSWGPEITPNGTYASLAWLLGSCVVSGAIYLHNHHTAA